LEARRGTRPLPPHPLLISFDDGWDDNVRYAAPILAAQGTPWALFVAAQFVDIIHMALLLPGVERTTLDQSLPTQFVTFLGVSHS